MKTYGGIDIWIHIFLISVIVGGESSASRPGHFTPSKETFLQINFTPTLIYDSLFTITSIVPLQDIFQQQGRYYETTSGGEKEKKNKTEDHQVTCNSIKLV
jgi:hypothetical protein